MNTAAGRASALAELTGRHGLPPGAVTPLLELLGLLAREPIALTTVRDPLAAADVHVADSLVALELDEVRTARAIADLGRGRRLPRPRPRRRRCRRRASRSSRASGRSAPSCERAAERARLSNVDVVLRTRRGVGRRARARATS